MIRNLAQNLAYAVLALLVLYLGGALFGVFLLGACSVVGCR